MHTAMYPLALMSYPPTFKITHTYTHPKHRHMQIKTTSACKRAHKDVHPHLLLSTRAC